MPQPLPDDPLLGVTVGSYEISRLIGQGGMGRVYAAVQREVGSRVAIKVLNEEYARDPDLAERFFAEARAVNVIAHENIVNVVDLLRLPDGRPVIVMELLDGKTLRDAIADGPPPIGAIVHVMIEVLSALAAAHAVGIVHRDLKPDNILVLPSGRTKVLDFGVAKLTSSAVGTAPRTRTGALVGTPEYMAPEQIGAREVDARTDIYAAGIVLFEALTGSRPFTASSDFEVMRAHVDLPPSSPRSRRADIPVAIEAVILRALAKAPDDRFASATEMANALQAAAKGLPEKAWASLSAAGRPYALPAPLTPPQPRPAHDRPTLVGEARVVRDEPDTVPFGGTPPRPRAPETVDAKSPGPQTVPLAPPPRTTTRTLGLVLLGVAVVGVGAGAWWTLRGDTAKPAAPRLRYVNGDKQKELEKPASYNATKFDPVLFAPTARELARSLVADAELMFLKVVSAREDGTVDLTKSADKANVYLYRSPSAAGPEGVRDCIGVEPYPERVIAFVYPSKDCEYPLAAAPRCTLAEVWLRAKTERAFDEAEAHIGFFGEEGAAPYWYLDPSMGRRTGAGIRVEDACPTP